jgi:hypothetical protein
MDEGSTAAPVCYHGPKVHNAKEIAFMIDVHYWTTPNGHKITIFLEEAGLP